MKKKEPEDDLSTRRSVLKFGGGVAGGLFAGHIADSVTTVSATNTQLSIPAISEIYKVGPISSAQSLIQTNDGGYALAAWADPFGIGNFDALLVKTDQNGQLQWTQTYGGSGDDRASSIVQTADDGYVLLGTSTTYGAGGSDLWLLKTDVDGVKQWDRTYGSTGNEGAGGSRSLIQTADGGYALTGFTTSTGSGGSDGWVVKVDSNGIENWRQSFGDNDPNIFRSIDQTNDGGYIVGGFTAPPDPMERDGWIVKLDATGSQQWAQTFGTSGTEVGNSVIQTIDGGYALAGASGPPGGDLNIWLVKIDSTGVKQWSQTFPGSGRVAWEVVQTPDEGYVLAGYTDFSPDANFHLIKADSSGTLQWTDTFAPTPDNGNNFAYSLVSTNDDSYALTGQTATATPNEVSIWFVKR